MNLPPPPCAPSPPPPNSMPLPPLPERKSLSASGRDVPPPRPSSPPPPELICAAMPVGGMYALPRPWIEYATFSRWSQATTFNEQPTLCRKCETSPCQWPILTQHAGASSVASPRSSVSSERDLTMLRAPRSELPTTPNKSADIAPRAHHLPNGKNKQVTDPCHHLDYDWRVPVQIHASYHW
jgi:hypothetical protein